MNIALNELLLEKRDLHILYPYTEREQYIPQTLTFIEEGIEADEQVIVVENEKITAELREELKRRHSADVLDTVHFVNSLYFYRKSGSYNPSAIIAYFNELIQPYINDHVIFRSWAHVEWSGAEEPLHLIHDCETASDNIVTQFSFLHVCAYGKNRMSTQLATILLDTHPYVLSDGMKIFHRDSINMN